jgi:hypothetical protein
MTRAAPAFVTGGVGGADDGKGQDSWRPLLLFAPMAPRTDTARPAGVSRQSSIALN